MLKRLFLLLLPLFCATAMADVPQVTKFYPDSRNSVQPYRPNSTIYAYFNARITQAKAQVIQDGEVLGTVVFKASAPSYMTGQMKDTDPDNVAITLVQPGLFTLSLYEVEYPGEEGTETYSDTENPVATTVYEFFGQNGTVVNSVLLPDNTLKSYYPADKEEGVMIYTFSKAVKPDNITAFLEYGYGETLYTTNVPIDLSDDGITLIIDYRGMSLNPTKLAYGNLFFDSDGNPLPNPTTISLNVNGLNCVDGTKITTIATSLDGEFSVTRNGSLFQSMKYKDITFDTPVLKKAVFFAKDNVFVNYPTIVEGCDMMALFIDYANVLSRFDIKYTSDNINVVTPYEEITCVNATTFRTSLPEEIIACGSDHLIISLVNYEFNQDFDGADHTIKPLNIGNVIKEYTSVAELKNLEVGEEAVLNVPNGVVVTLSNDQGYCFLEDENDGLMVVTADYSQALQESVRITGKLAGTYQGGGMFMINPEASDYVSAPTNTSKGVVLMSVDGIDSGEYDYRLVSFVANENMEIEYDGENIIIGGVLPVVTNFVDNLMLGDNDKVYDVTGVLYNDPNMPEPMLIIRSAYDINQEIFLGVKQPVADNAATNGLYTLSGHRVATSVENLPAGVYILRSSKNGATITQKIVKR